MEKSKYVFYYGKKKKKKGDVREKFRSVFIMKEKYEI